MPRRVPRCSRHSTMQNRSCRDVPPKRWAQSAIGPMRRCNWRDGATCTSAAGAHRRRSSPTIWPIRSTRRSEAARLGLYALTKLRAYDALAAAVLDAAGAAGVAVVACCICAAAGQATRARRPHCSPCSALPGRYTASFAARGLGVDESHAAPSGPLREIVDRATSRSGGRHPGHSRAWRRSRIRRRCQRSTKMVADRSTDPALRLEAMTALAALHDRERHGLAPRSRLGSRSRRSARRALTRARARSEPTTFLSVAGWPRCGRDWTVRVGDRHRAGHVCRPSKAFRGLTVMLQDRDDGSIPAVLNALVATKAAGVDACCSIG